MNFTVFFRDHGVEKIALDGARVAELFAEACEERLAYISERASYATYNGLVWVLDDKRVSVNKTAIDFSRALRDYFENIGNADKAAFVGKYLNPNARKGLLDDARSYCAVSADRFDSKPWLFNCLNGTLDLSAAKPTLRTPRANDYLTQVSGVNFDPDAPTDVFRGFLSDLMNGNAEWADYALRCLGYSLFGVNDLKKFFVCQGSGNNGKSTLDYILRSLFGGYAAVVDPMLFEEKRLKSISARELEQRSALEKARYISVGEPQKGTVLNAGLIKACTGNDPVTATSLYSNSRTFTVKGKIFFFTNSFPRISDEAILRSSRLRYIPFLREFPEGEQDTQVRARLTRPEALSGALNCLLDGLGEVIMDGQLIQPDSVSDLVPVDNVECISEPEELEHILDFFDQEMTREPKGRVSTRKVYNRFLEYADAAQFRKPSFAEFKLMLRGCEIETGEYGNCSTVFGWMPVRAG